MPVLSPYPGTGKVQGAVNHFKKSLIRSVLLTFGFVEILNAGDCQERSRLWESEM
jgi:hypothetical protein